MAPTPWATMDPRLGHGTSTLPHRVPFFPSEKAPSYKDPKKKEIEKERRGEQGQREEGESDQGRGGQRGRKSSSSFIVSVIKIN